jgi:hypothetical protein
VYSQPNGKKETGRAAILEKAARLRIRQSN